ncbi:aldose epimerase family protein [Martelella endophytica]|uniref:Aldose 1-epimerase n=1 Tax=Martelella endophytica TaxID=1486262 RepID=A0A0D5LVW2_MAREN|nr:aldose epimerase family protein [Martelella endophytica]AJY47528.1 aldose epimerase [Martelella endophytica]
MNAPQPFGKTKDGETVSRVTISGGGLTAKVLNWGAVVQDLRLEGHDHALVLGFDSFDHYLTHSPYFGATPGRSSNRIANGRFSIDGKEYQVDCNEKGITNLHGGSDGIGVSMWEFEEVADDRVTLKIVDKDGRGGFPGNCTIRAHFHLKPGGVFSVVYESTTDQPTIANICNHTYFNLGNGTDTLDHELMIAADHYLPVDERQIPTGEIRPVDGTAFDFRKAKPMRQRDADGKQALFDHNFCFSPERTEKRPVIHVHAPSSGVTLDVLTTEPGVQFYAAFKLDETPEGLNGFTYGPFAGFCLETQVWPDAVNHKGFPNAILRPGETLRQETDYVFRKG